MVAVDPRPETKVRATAHARIPSAAQVPGKPPVRGRWRSGAVHRRREDVSAKVLESAMAALGPEDGATKAGLEAALRRVTEQDKAGVSPGRVPVEDARLRPIRLRPLGRIRNWPKSKLAEIEFGRRRPRSFQSRRSHSRQRGSGCRNWKPLSSMADFPGPEVDVLQAVLTRAKAAAVPPPLIVQVIQCQQFIERIVKRTEELHRVREAKSRRLQEGRQRLHRLQQEAITGAPTVSDRPAALDVDSEVVRLQDQVAHFQAQLATRASEGVRATVVVQESLSKKGRVRPEDFMCQTVEELIQWIEGRQSDIQHAVASGNATEVSRVGLMAEEPCEELDIEYIDVNSCGGGVFRSSPSAEPASGAR